MQDPKLLAEYDDDFWDLSLLVNLTVPYLLTKAFLPPMIAQGWGRIINISSGSGKRGAVRRGAYSATKHGLLGLTQTAALEVATTGVTVNAICPGPIRTVMLTRLLQHKAESEGQTLAEVEKSTNPMQRVLEPEEIADLAVYLASDAAHGITGQSLNDADGSRSILASHYQGKELNSPNDIVVRENGDIFFTDPTYGRRAKGDHELYVADSPRMHIRKFQVADDGSLSGGEVFAESTGEGTGAPDGLKVASTGHVFCAGPGGVHVYDPDDGICLGVIRTPAFCANFTWGGDDFLTFFMTSSQHLYRTRVKVAGIPLF